MTPRLRVGDRAICVTGDNLDGLIVTVTRVREDGYEATLGLESVSFFAEGELERLAFETQGAPSPVAEWLRTNLLWLLATVIGVGGIAALLIAALGSEGAL